MGNIPTLEEVKEYFKNAEIVKCLGNGIETDISINIVQDIHYDLNCFWVTIKGHSGNHVKLWSSNYGYAKILTYKQPTYTITKEQLLELENGFTLPKLKEWFPDVFKVKLEVGKWYKSLSEYGSLFEYLGKSKARGFFQGAQLTDEWEWIKSIKIREATEQEVF